MIKVILIILAIILAWVLIRFSRTKKQEVQLVKKEYNIQEGKIEYTDLDKPIQPLFSNKLRLVGKPDYVVKHKQTYIPVEIKKGNHDTPFQSHIMQLIAYCYLVEEKYKVEVPYGVLVYENYQTKIDYTEERKNELLDVMKIMRTQKNFKRNHNSINKCRACSFSYACKDKLK